MRTKLRTTTPTQHPSFGAGAPPARRLYGYHRPVPSVPNGPGRPIGQPRLRGQAGPGRRKKSLGRPRPLFRWPMKPMGPTGRPIGLTGVNCAKNKRNFGCVWPPVTTKAARPTRCGSIEQPLGLFRPNVPVFRRIRVFGFVTSPFFSRYIFSSSL